MLELNLFNLGIILIFIGFLLAIIAIFFSVLHGTKRGNLRGGGIIMIGPIPIVFGTDSKVLKWLMVLGILLVVFLIVLTFIK